MTLKTHSEEVLLEQKSKHLLLLETNADIMSLAMFHTEMPDSLRASFKDCESLFVCQQWLAVLKVQSLKSSKSKYIK